VIHRFLRLLVGGLFITGAANAAPVMDAGALFQQIEREDHPSTSSSESTEIISPRLPAETTGVTNVAEFTPHSILLTNVTVFDVETLSHIFDDVRGRATSLEEFKEYVGRVTNYYRSHGYPAAYAYLPEQTISEAGEVEVRVLEGYWGKLHLINRSRLNAAALVARLPTYKTGEVMNREPIERAVLLSNDVPGVIAQAEFVSGEAPGFSDLNVVLKDKPWLAARIFADNQGSIYTGDGNRLGVRTELNNYSGYGDKLTLNMLSGGFGMKYSQIEYLLPTSLTGEMTAGLDYSEVGYSLGREFLSSQSQGMVRSRGVFGRYPLIRSEIANYTIEARLQDKVVRDQILSVGDSNGRGTNALVVGVNGDSLSNGWTVWSVALTAGRLSFENATHRAIDSRSVNSEGYFKKINGSFVNQSPVSVVDGANVMLSVTSQVNLGRNLDSSEKMVVGGAHGVRAYPTSEGAADQAILATLEYRQPLIPGIETTLFADYARGQVNAAPWGAIASSNGVEISGGGIGVKVRLFEGGYLSAQGAWRITSVKPRTDKDMPGGRLWVEFSWSL